MPACICVPGDEHVLLQSMQQALVSAYGMQCARCLEQKRTGAW